MRVHSDCALCYFARRGTRRASLSYYKQQLLEWWLGNKGLMPIGAT